MHDQRAALGPFDQPFAVVTPRVIRAQLPSANQQKRRAGRISCAGVQRLLSLREISRQPRQVAEHRGVRDIDASVGGVQAGWHARDEWTQIDAVLGCAQLDSDRPPSPVADHAGLGAGRHPASARIKGVRPDPPSRRSALASTASAGPPRRSRASAASRRCIRPPKISQS